MDQLFIELFQPVSPLHSRSTHRVFMLSRQDWTCIESAYMPSWCLGQDGGLPGRSPAALAARAKSKARVIVGQATSDATAGIVKVERAVVTRQ